MNLSGKKLTTAILAGLMGATVVGISVVGAENPVVLDGTTLKVSTNIGTKPIMNPVNVTKGIIDGTTTGGNIVKSDSTVGANLNALDAAVVGKADKAALDAKANKTDFDALKTKVGNAKVDTALHVDKDGKLVVGTDKKVNKAVSVEKGFKDGTTEAGQGNIISADNTVGQNLTALDTAIAANKQETDEALAKKADQADLEKAKVDTALHVDKDGKLVVGTDKKVNKAVSVEKGFKDGTTEAGQGNIVSADNTVGQNLTALDNAVATNQKAIGTETKERAAADQTLQDNIDAEATARDQAVAQERAERKGADAAQDKVIKQVNDNLVSSVNTINKNVADGFNALSAVDLQEAQTRAAADQTLQNQIANNTQAIGTTKDGNYVKSNNSVGQNLNALDAQVGQNSANINQLFSDYSSMKTDINKVGARSAALAGLHPLDFDPANKLNFAVASGSFKGENSVALGAFYRPNENVMFSAASTMGDSDNAYTFGLSFKIGPSSAKTKTTSPDAEELYKVVGQLQDQLAAQQKEIEQLKAEKTAK
ncbi:MULTISPECIES: YadA C-terminal domain-containing protein [unclassified Megasphaera]|uniref:YadA C-terminal domain-containing protein n=1 Tax=unclassified Megasphaera TaxID=2626256 RepID=UPI000EF0B639|nr:YadA C-terminal domain-containing protein [Megasphaera sp. UBA4233]HAM04687.1 hypothetical protein [Megasphaera sp.]